MTSDVQSAPRAWEQARRITRTELTSLPTGCYVWFRGDDGAVKGAGFLVSVEQPDVPSLATLRCTQGGRTRMVRYLRYDDVYFLPSLRQRLMEAVGLDAVAAKKIEIEQRVNSRVKSARTKMVCSDNK